MELFREYALLVAIALPCVVLVALQVFLWASGERGTLFLPAMSFGAIDWARSVQPAVARTETWRLFREYAFDEGSDAIEEPSRESAREVALHLDQHPAEQVALDGADPRCVESVLAALKAAGVPSLSIRIGPFDDPVRRNERRVAVLVGG